MSAVQHITSTGIADTTIQERASTFSMRKAKRNDDVIIYWHCVVPVSVYININIPAEVHMMPAS